MTQKVSQYCIYRLKAYALVKLLTNVQCVLFSKTVPRQLRVFQAHVYMPSQLYQPCHVSWLVYVDVIMPFLSQR